MTTLREAAQMALNALMQSETDPHGQVELSALEDAAIEALRAALAADKPSADRLAQPKQEPVAKMREMLEVQGQHGTWNYDPYFHGMYNGMEFMLAMVEGREPVFRNSPGKWLGYTAPQRECAGTAHDRREWQGLTDEEKETIYRQADKENWHDQPLLEVVEAKLREKNS